MVWGHVPDESSIMTIVLFIIWNVFNQNIEAVLGRVFTSAYYLQDVHFKLFIVAMQ